MGMVLGEGMPEKTVANIFIERGLKGIHNSIQAQYASSNTIR